MSYLVLARKYRPQSFSEIVEQSHVTKTLSNAILSNRVAHAILLSGPRGTGKTTIARIIAKSMNCVSGPTPSPCNICRSCIEITSGHSVDVFEIDGASNNSVDQIRELRENIRYMPAHSSYKIYIIDEVHMLSTAAFNALLKTLEEPPPHVMFIFATTESHKIPVTILSRCQRHELRRIPLESIRKHLVSLCHDEKADIPLPVIETVTQESGGSMRDALSLLDQLIGSMPEGASADDLLSIIGVAGRDVIHSACSAIIDGNAVMMLEKIEEVYSRGLELGRFYNDVTVYMRDLVLIKSGCSDRTVKKSGSESERIDALLSKTSALHLLAIVENLINSEQTIKFSGNPRIAVEMIFMRLINMRDMLSVKTLISKIDELKNLIGGNTGATTKTDQPDIPSGRSRTADMPLSASTAAYVQPEHQITEKIMKDQAFLQEPAGRQNFPEGTLTGDVLLKFWAATLRNLEKKAGALYTMMTGSRIVSFTGSELAVEITGNRFTLGRVQSEKSKITIREAAEEIIGSPIKKIEIMTVSEDPAILEDSRRLEDIRQKAIHNPLVTKAVEIFGGKIKDVKILGEDSI